MTPAFKPFPLGEIVMTTGTRFIAPPEELLALIKRHASGDWGDIDDFDKTENNRYVHTGQRLLSNYRLSTGKSVYVITEADRSITTVLLPDEY